MKLSQAATILLASIVQLTFTKALEVIKSENPTGGYIVSFTEGFLKPQDDELIAMDAKDKILQVIQGGEFGNIGASSHGEIEYVYDDGFAGTLDGSGLQNVLNSTDVLTVEEDGYVELDQVRSWGLDRIDDERLPLDRSYNPAFGNNGAGVTAYVIDTGILASHVEFGGRATQEYNGVSGDPNRDCHGHGTHVAGTIGSTHYGVANKVKLVGVKVLSCRGSGTWSGVIAGINWVRANAKKPATANLSLGGGKSSSVNAAINALVASGVTTVVAAGNSNRDACGYSPASQPNAITVASTTLTDYRSSFSNWGSCVDVFAPGTSIAAPWIGSNTAIGTKSGTSMASPHVCGAAALYLGQDKSLSVTAVTSKLLNDSIKDKIRNPGSRTPNRMLFVGKSQQSEAWTWTNYGVGSAAGWAATKDVKLLEGDFNGDGRTDIALVRQGTGWGSIPVLFARDNGSWHITNYGVGGAAGWAATKGVELLTGDFNGDGKTDIALVRKEAGWGSIPVLFARGNGSWHITNHGVGSAAGWAATKGVELLTGDFNGDRKTDIALVRKEAGWGSIPVLFARGDGSWHITNYGVGSAAGWAATKGVELLTGDFNGDSKTDIALVRKEAGWGSIPVLFARGNGSWHITNYGVGYAAGWAATKGVELLTGDFNGDGKTDIALVRKEAGWPSMPIVFAQGNGSWRVTNYGVGPAAGWAATKDVKLLTGDFNGDKTTDIALVRQGEGWGSIPIVF